MAVNLTTSMVLNHLKEGMTRSEIGTMYGLNGVQTKILFSHPKLKNKKTIKEKGVAFVLVDDLEDAPVVPGAEPTPTPVENIPEVLTAPTPESEVIEIEDHQVAESLVEELPIDIEESAIENEVADAHAQDEVIEIPDIAPATRTRRAVEPAEEVKTSELGW